MNTKFLSGIIVASLLLIPNSVFAGRFTDQVKTQLAAVGLLLGLGDDYEFTHDPYVDSIRHGRIDSLTLTLRAGTAYALVGVCDEDCRDIDLRVYDEDDHLVGKDMASDDKPIIQISPRWTGRFRIEVLMNTCVASPCFYGIGTFGKSRW